MAIKKSKHLEKSPISSNSWYNYTKNKEKRKRRGSVILLIWKSNTRFGKIWEKWSNPKLTAWSPIFMQKIRIKSCQLSSSTTTRLRDSMCKLLILLAVSRLPKIKKRYYYLQQRKNYKLKSQYHQLRVRRLNYHKLLKSLKTLPILQTFSIKPLEPMIFISNMDNNIFSPQNSETPLQA